MRSNGSSDRHVWTSPRSVVGASSHLQRLSQELSLAGSKGMLVDPEPYARRLLLTAARRVGRSNAQGPLGLRRLPGMVSLSAGRRGGGAGGGAAV